MALKRVGGHWQSSMTQRKVAVGGHSVRGAHTVGGGRTVYDGVRTADCGHSDDGNR